MGAADDMKKGLTKSLANFTKQRKAEEKHSSAGRWRRSRMIEVRGKFLTEAANEVMEECYMKASDNNRLPATARQIYYVARPLIEEQTDKPLSYAYFSQTLLPNFVNEHGADWDVVYDDRGHFTEPHTKRVVGLGTLNVRAYLNRVDRLKLEEADFDPASVKTYGPNGSFSAVLYVEKEGFMPLFKRVKLAKRYDIAIMSSKGMSVTAARVLVNSICSGGVPLLVLHDFDSAGIIIKDTLENDTRRYSYTSPPNVIDLGLHYRDINGLPSEPNNSSISDERLGKAGLTQAAINFLRNQRVELNALTSRQLIDFVEAKLKQHGIGKVIPSGETLARTYEMFAASDRLSEAFEELKEKLEDESEGPIKVPKNLETRVKSLFQKYPDISWHRAVQLLIDPDAPEDEDDEENDGDHEDDEDLSDIDE
jgi:Topoisomerase 6 subunit A/Spo11, Toprim domain